MEDPNARDKPNDLLRTLPSYAAAAPEPPAAPARSRIFYGPHGLRAGWRLLIFLAILAALFSSTALALRFVAHRAGPGTGITPGAALLGEGIPFLFVLIASWIMARLERRTIADYGLPRLQAFGTRTWQGAVIGFGSISALLGAMRIAGAFHVSGLALRGIAIWKYALLWGAAFVVVALFEEFLFRGYGLFTLTTGIGFWPAAIVLSVVFGYVHHSNSGETWVGAFAAGMVGLLSVSCCDEPAICGWPSAFMPPGIGEKLISMALRTAATSRPGTCSMQLFQVRGGLPVGPWGPKGASSASDCWCCSGSSSRYGCEMTNIRI